MKRSNVGRDSCESGRGWQGTLHDDEGTKDREV